jgi:hypothetical protein
MFNGVMHTTQSQRFHGSPLFYIAVNQAAYLCYFYRFFLSFLPLLAPPLIREKVVPGSNRVAGQQLPDPEDCADHPSSL